MSATGRIEYIDALRGFTMILVVFHHIMSLGMGIESSVCSSLFITFRMPLFFFISGWMAMRLGEGGNVATPSLLPRAKRLLLPMLGASTLWLYYFPLSGLESPLVSTWEGLWSNKWKNGY